jgi:hypothetical protein
MGATFTEIQRHGNIALFEGVSDSGSKQFEIHILRDKLAHFKSTDAGKMILSSPSTSDWGRFGFTYRCYDRAMDKFRKLAEKSEQNVLDLHVPTLKEAS